ncbi:19351_t:CDS:2 [Rhizophagus irregularis]|nr:19351_t:CDS:2 [Rhizophagus irregularis]
MFEKWQVGKRHSEVSKFKQEEIGTDYVWIVKSKHKDEKRPKYRDSVQEGKSSVTDDYLSGIYWKRIGRNDLLSRLHKDQEVNKDIKKRVNSGELDSNYKKGLALKTTMTLIHDSHNEFTIPVRINNR